MKPDYKLVAKAKYIHTTADLASEIWHEVYKRYYPGKQLDTLVEELQSAEAIEADIDNDVNYFLVVLGGKNIGYFAWKMENTALHLICLLYTSDAADEEDSVDLGGRRFIKKKKRQR